MDAFHVCLFLLLICLGTTYALPVSDNQRDISDASIDEIIQQVNNFRNGTLLSNISGFDKATDTEKLTIALAALLAERKDIQQELIRYANNTILETSTKKPPHPLIKHAQTFGTVCNVITTVLSVGTVADLLFKFAAGSTMFG